MRIFSSKHRKTTLWRNPGEIPMPWSDSQKPRQASLLPTFLTNAIGRRPQQGAHDPRRFLGGLR